MRPKVSIIIPVYNAELFLAETINSVLNQNFEDFELLLVNDGSTDGSGQICQSFEDDRIIYLEIENGGVSNARNIGFKKSKGDYLAFLDADDVWLENRLSKTVELLDTDLELGLVHTHMQVIDAKSNKQDFIHAGKSGHILEDLLLWEECCIPAPSSILVRRPVMEHVGLFDTRLSTAADQELFIRICSAYQVGMVAEPLGLYRVHGNNMHLNVSRMEKEHILTYQIANSTGAFKNWKFKRRCFSNLYMILAGGYWVHSNKKLRSVLLVIKSLVQDPINALQKLLAKVR